MARKPRDSASQKKVLPPDESPYAKEQRAMKEYIELLNTTGQAGRRGPSRDG